MRRIFIVLQFFSENSITGNKIQTAFQHSFTTNKSSSKPFKCGKSVLKTAERLAIFVSLDSLDGLASSSLTKLVLQILGHLQDDVLADLLF